MEFEAAPPRQAGLGDLMNSLMLGTVLLRSFVWLVGWLAVWLALRMTARSGVAPFSYCALVSFVSINGSRPF